jgi:hypothetical protein
MSASKNSEKPVRSVKRHNSDPVPVKHAKPFFVSGLENSCAKSPSTPLAIFSARGVASPTNSPRSGDNSEGSPPTIDTPRPSLSSSGRALIKRLLTPRKESKTNVDDDGDVAPLTAEVHLTAPSPHPPSPHLERARSMPASPQLDQRSRDISNILEDAQEMIKNLSPRTIEDQSSSPEMKHRRHSMFLKATEGGSTRFGTTGKIEFDVETNEPLVRIRSHSSVEDLRKLLLEDAETSSQRGVCNPILSRSRSDSMTSCDSASESSTSTTTTTSSDSSYNRSPLSRLRRLSVRIIARETFTLIEYNPDPLARAPWQKFVVANSLIDPSIHTFLERASNSDVLDPWRLCDCKQNCDEHAAPDAVAKLAAVYLLDPTLSIPSKKLQNIITSIVKACKIKRIVFTRGLWSSKRVLDESKYDFNSNSFIPRYRFKMFT